MAPSSAHKKKSSPNPSPTLQTPATTTHVTSPPSSPPSGPLPELPTNNAPPAAMDGNFDDYDDGMKLMTGDDLKQIRSALQKSSLLTFPQRRELETLILRGYLEGRGGGGSKMGRDVGKYDDVAWDEEFLIHVKSVRIVMNGESDYRANKKSVERLKQEAKSIVPNAETKDSLIELQEKFLLDEETCEKTLELLNRGLEGALNDLKEKAENEKRLEEQFGHGWRGILRACGEEISKREKQRKSQGKTRGKDEEYFDVETGVPDAIIAAMAANENVDKDEIRKGIKEQQETAAQFIKNHIIPQKTSKKNVERFCQMVQVPQIFGNLSEAIPLLTLDQSHSIHPNPMITDILQATHHLRPGVPSRQKRPKSEPASEPSSPIHKRPKAQPFQMIPFTPGSLPQDETDLAASFGGIQIAPGIVIAPPGLDMNKLMPPPGKSDPVQKPLAKEAPPRKVDQVQKPLAKEPTQSKVDQIQHPMAKKPTPPSAKPLSNKRWLSDRLTQVFDLSDYPIKKPYPDLETQESLMTGLAMLWEEHCRGKQNKDPIYRGGSGDFWLNEANPVGSATKPLTRPITGYFGQQRPWSGVPSAINKQSKDTFELKQEWLPEGMDEADVDWEEAQKRVSELLDQARSGRRQTTDNKDRYDVNPQEKNGAPAALTREQKQYIVETMPTLSVEAQVKVHYLVRRYIPDIPDEGKGKESFVEYDMIDLPDELLGLLLLFVLDHDPKDNSELRRKWAEAGEEAFMDHGRKGAKKIAKGCSDK